MTLHPGFTVRAGLALEPPSEPPDPALALEEAVRVARASSHSRKLESAQQAAFSAWADAFPALIAWARVRDRELAALRARVEALESDRAWRLEHSPVPSAEGGGDSRA